MILLFMSVAVTAIVYQLCVHQWVASDRKLSCSDADHGEQDCCDPLVMYFTLCIVAAIDLAVLFCLICYGTYKVAKCTADGHYIAIIDLYL